MGLDSKCKGLAPLIFSIYHKMLQTSWLKRAQADSSEFKIENVPFSSTTIYGED